MKLQKLLFVTFLGMVYGDFEFYSSSVRGLLKVLDMENKFMTHVKAYGDALQEKLDFLNMHLEILDREPCKEKSECEEFVSNPLRAFKLLRRIREDWRHLQVYTKLKPGQVHLDAMKELLTMKPNMLDLQEAQLGLARIEFTYGLSPKDMAKGRLQNKQFNKNLSLRDCLAIAKHRYDFGHYSSAALWYRIILQLKPEAQAEIYNEALGKPSVGQRRKFAMACVAHDLQRRQPELSDKELQTKVEEILSEMKSIDIENLVRQLLLLDDTDFSLEMMKSRPEFSATSSLCQDLQPKRQNLQCRYNTTATPFLRLAPLKMEEINLDPYIVLYHNVMSNVEIEEMKSLATNLANGISTLNFSDPSAEIVARMQSLTEELPFVQRLNRRITDISGFDMNEFKNILVANYGLGSYFKPHYDYVDGKRVTAESVEGLGDRVASLIIYAGDVSLGGATVFPEIKVAVTPEKGSGLLWYNLFDNGAPDPRTLHSVCPVVVGDRWTLTKWIHNDAQMFIKPCLRNL